MGVRQLLSGAPVVATRSGVRRACAAVVGAAVVGCWLFACLQDAPAPMQCPPGAAVAANSCSSVQPKPGESCGVARDDVRRCLNLATCKAKCDSVESECPSDPSACYPPGDCPEAVTAVSQGAACFRVPAGSFQENVSNCSCGCMACMSVCDGRGPVVFQDGPAGDAGVGMPLATIDLEGLLPARGSLSVYALMRGAGTLRVEATGATAGSVGVGEFRRKSASSWEDTINLKTMSDGKRYSWGQDPNSGPPRTLTLYAGEGAAAVEIDCIIPYVEQVK